MSENIKITIVTHNEKSNMKFDAQKDQSVIVTHDSSMTVMSTLLKNNLINGSFCGGRGDCGRCRIQFITGVTIPAALERNVMEPEELRQGYRLACLAKPKDDCVIRLALLDSPEISIISDVIDMTENNDYISQRHLETKNQKPGVTKYTDTNASVSTMEHPDIVEEDDKEKTKAEEKGTLIAVDLGTTTIAMQLMTMDTGHIIDTYCEMNPQRSYGSDVLSRIQASCEGSREILRKLAVEVLERGVKRFRGHNTDIKCMCIAGNTAMQHLFMGHDVSSLGRSPFTPVEIGLQEYQHAAWDFPALLTPGISAFVGGDIVAGLYACNMLTQTLQRQPAGQEDYTGRPKCVGRAKNTILIDLGTNGEMAITNGVHMIVTATAAGPAFEGGAGAGIVGSDMIACAAELLRQGIMDETGLLKEPYFTEGVSVLSSDIAKDGQSDGQNKHHHKKSYIFKPGRVGQSLYLSQEDIRALQMAKAAVRAGVEILSKRLSELRTDNAGQNGVLSRGQQINHVYLAGGFGYYLDVEAAFRIGLLPEYMRGHVQAVGNTSLLGAYRIGRDLWQRRIDKQALEGSLSFAVSINLAQQEEFEKLYIRYMNFESK